MKERLIFVLFLLIIPIVMAEEIQQYYKTDNLGTLQFACYDRSGLRCSSTTLCNISVTDPEGTRVIINQRSTKNNDLYEYNFTPNKVGNYGVYLYCYMPNQVDYAGYSTIVVQSNHQGKEIVHYGAILAIFGIIIILMLIFLVFLIIKGSVWIYPHIMVLTLTTLLFLYTWWSYSVLLSNILFTIYKIFTWLSYPIIILCLFEMMAAYWSWLSKKKQAKRAYGDNF